MRVYDLGEDADARKIMGSTMFLAPEVRRGEKATAASDAYALGVTFYRLLTGVWYEPGPVADGLLEAFGREWSSTVGQLLSDNPARRLPLPTIELANHSMKRRWCAVALVLAALALGRGERRDRRRLGVVRKIKTACPPEL